VVGVGRGRSRVEEARGRYRGLPIRGVISKTDSGQALERIACAIRCRGPGSGMCIMNFLNEDERNEARTRRGLWLRVVRTIQREALAFIGKVSGVRAQRSDRIAQSVSRLEPA
jgi:hypothetical protein